MTHVFIHAFKKGGILAVLFAALSVSLFHPQGCQDIGQLGKQACHNVFTEIIISVPTEAIDFASALGGALFGLLITRAILAIWPGLRDDIGPKE